jgi:flavin reductase (DIM6/NTAB) family NADH-FMN oxidoreductase RutF
VSTEGATVVADGTGAAEAVFDGDTFRKTLGTFVTGVTVITTRATTSRTV